MNAIRSKGYLKVAEVTDDVSVFLLVALVSEPEHSGDEVREAQQLSDDGVSPGHDPQDGLAAQVILSKEVHRGGNRLQETIQQYDRRAGKLVELCKTHTFISHGLRLGDIRATTEVLNSTAYYYYYWEEEEEEAAES